jgi:biopolymer transport protein ExbD
MSRHKRRHTQDEVELNLAAMLDMAFQLLAFFVLTFRPSPVEGQLALNMPPPAPITNLSAPVTPSEVSDTGGVFIDNSFVIGIRANADGSIASVSLDFAGDAMQGPATDAALRHLEGRLRDIFGSQGSPFDQVVIRVDPKLHYEELMKIVDVCLRQKLPDGQPLQKLSFSEMGEAELAQ